MGFFGLCQNAGWKSQQTDECQAGGRGKHDWIFANQKRLTLATLSSHANALQLDTGTFTKCLYSEGMKRVRAEQEAARSLQIDGTPTFFIGRIGADGTVNVSKRLTGAKSAAAISVALDELLNVSAEKLDHSRPY